MSKCKLFSNSSPAISPNVLNPMICTAPFLHPFAPLTDTLSDWDRIKSPAEDQIIPYANLPKPKDSANLNKLAVLKVNGGLGTSMGLSSPLSPCSS